MISTDRYESEYVFMMWGYDYSWFNISLMMLGMTLWVALLVVLTWALIGWLNRKARASVPQGDRSSNEPTAVEILRLRYARGEIDTATYEHMREQLDGLDTRRSQYGDQPLAGAR
jgi:uncharacterized membrane protein